MKDFGYQKMAAVNCPACDGRVFVPRPIAPGQEIARTCPECGLRIVFERKPIKDTNTRRIGPEETK